MFPQISAGSSYGQWRLVRRLGKGGNGEVWLARGFMGEVAIKFLTKIKSVAYSRFKDEVFAMQTCQVPGVVPIIETHLPSDLKSDRCWYAMPVGIPLWNHLAGAGLPKIAAHFADLALVFAKLHERPFLHRDIKPANLLTIAGAPCVGDFGLVDYPAKGSITGVKEHLGPRYCMAPEVFRHGADATSSSSDVYAFAKTFWMFATRRDDGFDGQYTAENEIALSKYWTNHYLKPLDDLLVAATAHAPEGRPTMAEFEKSLRHWLTIAEQWKERNRLEWADTQRRLFPFSKPERAIWRNVDEVVNVLTFLGARSSLNHLFFPTGGGLDLTGARRSRCEDGCIELLFGRSAYIVKPRRLIFESIRHESQWDYFRLEAHPLVPTGVYEDHREGSEELVELREGEYVEPWHWDAAEYDGKPLPRTSRPVTRVLKGSFVVFQKSSIYNQISATYDARHARMSANHFRKYIAELAEATTKVISQRTPSTP